MERRFRRSICTEVFVFLCRFCNNFVKVSIFISYFITYTMLICFYFFRFAFGTMQPTKPIFQTDIPPPNHIPWGQKNINFFTLLIYGFRTLFRVLIFLGTRRPHEGANIVPVTFLLGLTLHFYDFFLSHCFKKLFRIILFS